jgi:hypothetical protein
MITQAGREFGRLPPAFSALVRLLDLTKRLDPALSVDDGLPNLVLVQTQRTSQPGASDHDWVIVIRFVPGI